MNRSPIEWTDFTSNPIRAGRGHAVPYLDERELQRLLKRRKPCKVFLGDMTDIFGDWVPDEWLDQIFAVMALTPHVTYQLLTKRAERMRAYLTSREVLSRLRTVRLFPGTKDASYLGELFGGPDVNGEVTDWPLPNVWLGVSAENQEYADKRIPDLLQTPAAVRFASFEPLLADMGDLCYPTDTYPDGPPMCCNGHECGCMGLPTEPPVISWLDWIICGGESGPNARPCDIAWIRSVVEQCRAAGTKCFVKQAGSFPVYQKEVGTAKGGSPVPLELKSAKGGDPEEWPEWMRVREFPTK